MDKKKFRKILKKLSYEIELVTQLLLVLTAAITYGIIESEWVPTDQFSENDLTIFGHWSPYHLCLVIMMAVASSALALSHIQWILIDRKKYILLMVLAALPLSLMIEDATWFVVRWEPISYDSWTMIQPGLGVNLGLTWIPLWYIVVMAFSSIMYWLASRYAEKGYRKYLELNPQAKF